MSSQANEECHPERSRGTLGSASSADRRMLNAECFLILQAKENKGQTRAGVVERTGKRGPPPGMTDFHFGSGPAYPPVRVRGCVRVRVCAEMLDNSPVNTKRRGLNRKQSKFEC